MLVTNRVHATLPPVPATLQERCLLAFHPEEKSFWLLGSRQLWRVTRDGAGTLIVDVEPSPRGAVREMLRYNSKREAMVHIGQAKADGPLVVSVFDGATFVPLATKGGAPAAEYDGIVYDVRRSVLVHFHAPRVEGGTVTVRELGDDGTWRAATGSAPCGDEGVLAGWDARSSRAIVLAAGPDRTSKVYAWDGASFTPLADLPVPMSGWPAVMMTAPQTGAFVMLRGAPFESSPGGPVRDGAELWELEGTDKKRAWKKRDAAGLEVFGGAAHDSDRDVTVVFGTWFGPGTHQHTLATYDGEQLVAAGLPVVELEGGSSGGPVRFWGRRNAASEPSERKLQELYRACVLYKCVDGALAQLSHTPGGRILASAAGTFVLTDDGALLQLDGTWSQRAAAHPGYMPRTGATCAIDAAGRILVLCGENRSTGKMVEDGFLFDGEWKPLPAKGLPLLSGGTAVHDAARDAWIVLGGSNRKGKDDRNVYELVAGKWSSYACAANDPKLTKQRWMPTIAGWDEPTRQVFLYALLSDASYKYQQRLFGHRGGGLWQDLGAVESSGPAAAWDSVQRIIVTMGGERTTDLAIGAALDAAPAPLAAPVTKAKKPAKAKEAPAATTKATAHVMSFGAKGEDQFGGPPLGVTALQWPRCASCGVAMQHVLTLHADPARLPLKAHAALSVFVCNSKEACATWSPRSGCNAVLLRSAAHLAETSAAKPPSDGKISPPPFVRGGKIAYEEQVELDPASDDGAPLEAVSKVGGYPVWVQSPDVPACTKCKKPMRFVAQLLEESSDLNFGGGDGYVFCCGKEHEGAFLWQQ